MDVGIKQDVGDSKCLVFWNRLLHLVPALFTNGSATQHADNKDLLTVAVLEPSAGPGMSLDARQHTTELLVQLDGLVIH